MWQNTTIFGITQFDASFRRNSFLFQELFINDVNVLAASSYVKTKPTKIYVHGFTENGQGDLSFRLRNRKYSSLKKELVCEKVPFWIINLIPTGFLEKEDINFIALDWALLAAGPDYPRAAANTRLVGLLTGDFVNFLVSQGTDLIKLHLIGFSMGAHVVGLAGHITNGVLPRITGRYSLTDLLY